MLSPESKFEDRLTFGDLFLFAARFTIEEALHIGVSNNHFGTLHFQTRWRLRHRANIAQGAQLSNRDAVTGGAQIELSFRMMI